jgi:hypothetical protein
LTWLAVGGVGALWAALGLAWCIVGARFLGIRPLRRLFADDVQLVRAHVDYLLMSALLLGLSATGATFPAPVAALAILGAASNPALFLVLAVRPDVARSATSPFGVLSAASFLTTTLGFGAAGLCVILELP